MMPRSRSLARRWSLLALAALLLLPLAASAQDSPARAERLKQALDLTDAQAALVADALGAEARPGNLWAAAAALTPTLTDEQKAKLFARPELPERPRADRADRRARADRPARGERRADSTRAAQREAMWAAVKADMQAALGLSAAQVQQLEAFHAERRAEREARRADRQADKADRQQRRAERPAPGQLPEGLAAILTPAQQEIWNVHHALAMHLRAHGPRGMGRTARE